ncbi:hydroxyacid dehydrogenase [Metabacillus arenae]|uniref:hydroxyacid dehydrogenase n=1 Tax=Metabacillus arenae TaxID=2771434 RepID=UPI00296561D2|nr:hydroxyacid dehydrogenase [Metabacillus arenae]
MLVTEVMWEKGLQELKEFGLEVVYNESLWKDREELLNTLHLYDGLIVRNQTKVDQELLSAALHLKVIGRLGVGLDNIDVKAAKNHGAKVVYARNANATSVAEYVMTAILSASRPLLLADQDIREGGWDRKRFTGEEISNKTIGLIGLGEIAHRVAKRANSFGMKVIGFDPFMTDYEHIISETGVEKYSSLKEVLHQSDFISIHVPLTADTKHLISHKELDSMKANSYLLNTSRGGIIDESALTDALVANKIAGAYIDVLEEEPINPSHPLLQCKNAILTPHIAGLTNESQTRTSLLIAQEVGKLLKGGHSLCLV